MSDSTSSGRKTILVTGATGNQGGAVIDEIIAAGKANELTILAVTRNTESNGAKKLVSKAPQSIKLVRGDMNDCESLFASIKEPIHSVFCVSIPAMGFRAKEGAEENTANALIDAAHENGVKHFVFTSVDRHGAESDSIDTECPHFISKAKIERHLKQKFSGPDHSWTILRPVAFMENITTGFAGKIFPTAWQVGLPSSTKLQVVSTKDIGWFGAQALLRPKDFSGRAVSLAGDELTFEQANAIFQREAGMEIPTTYGFIASFLLWAISDVGLMFKFFETKGYAADIEALKKEHPGLRSLEDWVKSSPFAKN
ncbi:hypothetical protein BP5796_04598 [Coleophoma crateriformis]|uniref:NmrA-like domain-containing protein n=1 Tax=Coleophoma crateriformis TaxID=565419 RepID=A0A3D8S9S9_9HELO|nr:hypothetical protein BP5796_04598 [Coleophoma crateriformis]